MSVLDRSTLPNALTVGRIVLSPAIFFLILAEGFAPRLLAFVLFVIAAVTDLVDGHLARKYGWISNFGKLVDPIADKLLLVVTFVPIYMLSHGPGPVGKLPYWGVLPLWVVVVIFGRELLITAMRMFAARRGVVVPAIKVGKHKAVTQNISIGSIIFWYALQTAAYEHGWSGVYWDAWQWFHGAVLAITLGVAVVLTIWSMLVYLWSWRTLSRPIPPLDPRRPNQV